MENRNTNNVEMYIKENTPVRFRRQKRERRKTCMSTRSSDVLNVQNTEIDHCFSSSYDNLKKRQSGLRSSTIKKKIQYHLIGCSITFVSLLFLPHIILMTISTENEFYDNSGLLQPFYAHALNENEKSLGNGINHASQHPLGGGNIDPLAQNNQDTDQNFFQSLLESFNIFENQFLGLGVGSSQGNKMSIANSLKTTANGEKRYNYESSHRHDLYELSVNSPQEKIQKSIKEQELHYIKDQIEEQKCLTFKPSDGVWTYEWCHGNKVSRYREDVSTGEKYSYRNLGKFEGEISRNAELYSNGDFCEKPSSQHRFSHVIYECCRNVVHSEDGMKESGHDYHSHNGEYCLVGEKENHLQKMEMSEILEGKETKDNQKESEKIYIQRITQPEACHYQVHVCVPTLCQKRFSNEDHKKAKKNQNSHEHTKLFPPMSKETRSKNKEKLVQMFTHAYDSYMYNAFPASELKPLSCKGGVFNLVKLPCLTLIDTIDTLILMRNYTEFARSVERLREEDERAKLRFFERKRKSNRSKIGRPGEVGGIFAFNEDVSVFETNIRVLGGLLSAHQLAIVAFEKYDIKIPACHIFNFKGSVGSGSVMIGPVNDTSCFYEDPYNPRAQVFVSKKIWKYDGFLLDLALDIGQRLLPAFETDTGIPYVSSIDGFCRV